MIEASVILLVLVGSVLLFFGARLMAQNSRRNNPEAEKARLDTSLAWHEERLLRARQKGWDYDMISRINEQIAETRAKLAELRAAESKS